MGPVGQRMPEPSFRYDGRDTKGISKSNYYYRFRRIRKACLEHISEGSLPCQQVVEISENIMHLPESTTDISIVSGR